MNKKNKFLVYLSLLLFIALTQKIYAKPVSNDGQLWTALQFSGALIKNQPYLYLFELHARFKNDDDIYKMRGALGYAINDNLSLLFGLDFQPDNEYRLWQQLQWEKDMQTFGFISRTRLEQRKNKDFSEFSLRLRQRFTIKLFGIKWNKITPLIYDELFITNSLNQNRVFLGIDVPLKKYILQIGYLNRIQFNTQKTDISHILWIAFKV